MPLDLANSGPRNTGVLRAELTLFRAASLSSHPFSCWAITLVCIASHWEIKHISPKFSNKLVPVSINKHHIEEH
jgi:hypothetical protein